MNSEVLIDEPAFTAQVVFGRRHEGRPPIDVR